MNKYKFKTPFVNSNSQIVREIKKQTTYLQIALSKKTNLKMTVIPSGEFLMGSSTDESEFRANETPQHKVKIPKFYLGKYPITQSQYFAVMNELPEIAEEFQGEDLPVVNVWLEKALEFCDKLSKNTGKTFRLPTEAEWEYACRAGTDTPYAFGVTITKDIANFDGICLTPVGHFKFANNFGLYDMHGNVWEWCADIWHTDYKDAPTNGGNAWIKNGDQSYVVQRGGSWKNPAGHCRSAFRVGDIAHNLDHIVGLRVCMTSES